MNAKHFAWMVLTFFAASTPLMAQGIIPTQDSSTQTVKGAQKPLLIEQKVPETLTITGENGKQRSLLSYKSPLEIMVVVFFSTPCQLSPDLWPTLRRLTQDYEGWRVTFVGVSASPTTSLQELAQTFAQEKLSWPLLHDDHRTAVNVLKITTAPEFLIIDEYGILKYRGPLAPLRHALDTVISHIDNIKEPEPSLAAGCAP